MDESNIIQYMLGLLSQIKLYHWATMKYSIHKALDELHSKTHTNVDKFVESYVGRFKKQPLKKFTIHTSANTNMDELMTWLETERDNLDKMQKPLAKASELQNILQEMIADFDTAIYLCKLT